MEHQRIAFAVGELTLSNGELAPADHKVDGGPSIFFDAVAILPSDAGGKELALDAAAVNWLRDAYAHLKTIGYVAWRYAGDLQWTAIDPVEADESPPRLKVVV